MVETRYQLLALGPLPTLLAPAAASRTCAVTTGGDVLCWGEGARFIPGEPR